MRLAARARAGCVVSDGLWELFEKEARAHGCSGASCQVCAADSARNAQQAALDHAQDWRHRARSWFDNLDYGTTFTSEDVTAAVGMPAGTQGANRNNAVGAFLRTLSVAGLVKKVDLVSSKNARSHGAALILWKKQ